MGKVLKVILIGTKEYSEIYQQALMTALKAQSEGVTKIEIEVIGDVQKRSSETEISRDASGRKDI